MNDPCGCPQNEGGDISCHVCGEKVNIRCWRCQTPRGEGVCHRAWFEVAGDEGRRDISLREIEGLGRWANDFFRTMIAQTEREHPDLVVQWSRTDHPLDDYLHLRWKRRTAFRDQRFSEDDRDIYGDGSTAHASTSMPK